MTHQITADQLLNTSNDFVEANFIIQGDGQKDKLMQAELTTNPFGIKGVQLKVISPTGRVNFPVMGMDTILDVES